MHSFIHTNNIAAKPGSSLISLCLIINVSTNIYTFSLTLYATGMHVYLYIHIHICKYYMSAGHKSTYHFAGRGGQAIKIALFHITLHILKASWYFFQSFMCSFLFLLFVNSTTWAMMNRANFNSNINITPHHTLDHTFAWHYELARWHLLEISTNCPSTMTRPKWLLNSDRE